MTIQLATPCSSTSVTVTTTLYQLRWSVLPPSEACTVTCYSLSVSESSRILEVGRHSHFEGEHAADGALMIKESILIQLCHRRVPDLQNLRPIDLHCLPPTRWSAGQRPRGLARGKGEHRPHAVFSIANVGCGSLGLDGSTRQQQPQADGHSREKGNDKSNRYYCCLGRSVQHAMPHFNDLCGATPRFLVA